MLKALENCNNSIQFNLLQILKLHMVLFTLEMNIHTQYDNAHYINTYKFSSKIFNLLLYISFGS